MSPGHLKITDEKVVFVHTKSGRKDTLKGADIELVNWQRLAGVWGIRMFTKDGALHRFHPCIFVDTRKKTWLW